MPCGEHAALRLCAEGVHVQRDGRILPQLMLEPVHGVRPGGRGLGRVRHRLLVRGRKQLGAELRLGGVDAARAIEIVERGEAILPLLPVGQERQRGWLVGHECLDEGGMPNQLLKSHQPTGTTAEDEGRLITEARDQSPGILGIGVEPTAIVLRPEELTPGETAAVVGDDGVARGQGLGYALEARTCPAGAGAGDRL